MLDAKKAYEELSLLKRQEEDRNYVYYLLRQAVRGYFLWPNSWPDYIPKVKHNLCKPVSERFSVYLMGKGFSYNVDRPNSMEYREAAERTEKILRRLLELSNSDIQFDQGSLTGSQLGRTVYKVYRRGKKGAEHACFVNCQPDYFYGIASGDDYLSEFSKVYYSYPLDRLEAERLFGPGDYKTQAEMARDEFFEVRPDDDVSQLGFQDDRRVPVLEVWTKDNYLLNVGGVTKYNGENPNKWKDSGEGFIPYVVIENISHAGTRTGEADIAQIRELNQELNYVISRKAHVVGRWLKPTLVWEGAPSNYMEILTATVGGGGAIPTRIGSRLSFLSYERTLDSVLEYEQTLRKAILETAGMSEIALQGTVSGSINTGPALEAQFQPVLSTVEKKRKKWEAGLKQLFAMLLNVQEDIGNSKALGQAVVHEQQRSQENPDGDLVELSGKDIAGLRQVSISWPGVLPKDDIAASRLEMDKASQGIQSIYTTLEKLGIEYPQDEIARIRFENNDPSLRGSQVAEQLRAQAPLVNAETNQQRLELEQAEQGGLPALPPGEEEEELLPEGLPQGLGDRLRELRRNAAIEVDDEEDEAVIRTPPPAEVY